MRLTRTLFPSMVIALSSSVQGEHPAYLHLPGDNLAQGRAVWLETCEGCHGYGIAGAPVPMDPDDWRSRLQKPQHTLHEHAINGFFGPDDTHMPPRGGNPNLSDAEVTAAVDYMTALARFYLQNQEKSK